MLLKNCTNKFNTNSLQPMQEAVDIHLTKSSEHQVISLHMVKYTYTISMEN